MSVRTHAPDCAKTRALIESEEDSTGRRHVECTCGATYGPGVEAQRDALEREVIALRQYRAAFVATETAFLSGSVSPEWLQDIPGLMKATRRECRLPERGKDEEAAKRVDVWDLMFRRAQSLARKDVPALAQALIEKADARREAEKWRDRAADPNFVCGDDVLPWEAGR